MESGTGAILSPTYFTCQCPLGNWVIVSVSCTFRRPHPAQRPPSALIPPLRDPVNLHPCRSRPAATRSAIAAATAVAALFTPPYHHKCTHSSHVASARAYAVFSDSNGIASLSCSNSLWHRSTATG